MTMWKTLEKYGGNYEVSDLGAVRNKSTKQILVPQLVHTGYVRVWLYCNGNEYREYLHRLVADTFVEKTDASKTQVNHKNEIKTDNRACNLEWVTPKENINYGSCIEKRSKSRCKPVTMVIGSVEVDFNSGREACNKTGIPYRAISRCCTGSLKSTHGVKFKFKEGA